MWKKAWVGVVVMGWVAVAGAVERQHAESATVVAPREEGRSTNAALQRLGISEARVVFNLLEEPLTYEQALQKCHRWGMQLPQTEDLVALKPHLHGLLSGLSRRHEGFVWAGDASTDPKYRHRAFSLETRTPILATNLAKGVGLCVTYPDGPRGKARWMERLSDEMEQAFQGDATPPTLWAAYVATLMMFKERYPMLGDEERRLVEQQFTERRKQDPKFVEILNRRSSSSGSRSSGLGLTLDGRVGLSPGGGMVIPLGGTGPRVGVGF